MLTLLRNRKSRSGMEFEQLEIRDLFTIIPVTCSDIGPTDGCRVQDSFDHRWPSLNSNVDVVYSAQVSGQWEVFMLSYNATSPVQLTSGDHNKMYPSISDNGDVVYFQDGGSGGIGWQILRRDVTGSESQLEFSSRNISTGGHRDAGRFAAIASDGTSVHSYDFYNCAGCVPTRRFNVSGLGTLGPNFSGFDHPDINASMEIVYSGFGAARKASVSDPFPGVSIGPASMARINDNGDIVTVSGNLYSPGNIQVLAAPDYGESTTVGDGSWADINNSGHVVYEGFDSSGVRQIYLFDEGEESDIAATLLSIDNGVVSYSWEISGASLPHDTTVGLYWSNNDTFDSTDTPASLLRDIAGADREVGVYFDSIPTTSLTGAGDSSHLLLVVDPSEAIDDDNTNDVLTYDRCIPGELYANVSLPAVSLDIATVKFADLDLRFDPLDLDFTTRHTATTGAVCQAVSNVSTLDVRVVLTGQNVLLGGSTGQAIVTLFEGELIWQVPSGFLASWVTTINGIPITIPFYNTAPLSYVLMLNDHGLNSTSDSFQQIIRIAEPIIHTEMSQDIFGQWTNLVVWEDPGPTGLSLRDSHGNHTGHLNNGGEPTIPGSAYFPEIPLVLVTAPQDTTYTIDVVGIGSGAYELVTANIVDTQVASALSIVNTTEVGAVTTYSTHLGSNNLSVHLRGDANADNVVDAVDFNILASHLFTEGAAHSDGDFNFDTFVDVSDFNIWNFRKFIDVPPARASLPTLRTPRAPLQKFFPVIVDSNTSDSQTSLGGNFEGELPTPEREELLVEVTIPVARRPRRIHGDFTFVRRNPSTTNTDRAFEQLYARRTVVEDTTFRGFNVR